MADDKRTPEAPTGVRIVDDRDGREYPCGVRYVGRDDAGLAEWEVVSPVPIEEGMGVRLETLPAHTKLTVVARLE